MSPSIDGEVCIACGACVAACPTNIFRKDDEEVTPDPALAELCVQCGHCMAVCPTKAVSAPGFDCDDFGDLPDEKPDANAFMRLLMSRRSVRHFADQSVERETLERILAMAVTAPMGFPPSPVEVVVLQTPEQVQALVPMIIATYEEFEKQLGNWFARWMIRRAMGTDMFEALQRQLIPMLRPALQAYHEQGADAFTWGAPAMLIFHTDRRSLSGKDDCMIACTYAMLAAHALSLGATMIGMVAGAVQFSKELRASLQIPDGNDPVIALILGYPRVRFRRAIPRKFRNVTWMK